ncbi:MAG: hypothetical protein Q4D38_13695 [Planctomycetia bacterium]|nr:hypothetical protein [Planctomycetia bacterium]
MKERVIIVLLGCVWAACGGCESARNVGRDPLLGETRVQAPAITPRSVYVDRRNPAESGVVPGSAAHSVAKSPAGVTSPPTTSATASPAPASDQGKWVPVAVEKTHSVHYPNLDASLEETNESGNAPVPADPQPAQRLRWRIPRNTPAAVENAETVEAVEAVEVVENAPDARCATSPSAPTPHTLDTPLQARSRAARFPYESIIPHESQTSRAPKRSVSNTVRLRTLPNSQRDRVREELAASFDSPNAAQTPDTLLATSKPAARTPILAPTSRAVGSRVSVDQSTKTFAPADEGWQAVERKEKPTAETPAKTTPPRESKPLTPVEVEPGVFDFDSFPGR